MAPFVYTPIFPSSKQKVTYRLLTKEFIKTVTIANQKYLQIDPKGLTHLANEAFKDVSFFLRPAHLASLGKILKDPESSDNDLFVAETMIKNSVIAALGKLPTCQDTGTCIVMGKKGHQVLTDGSDEEALSLGVYSSFQDNNLRYSQLVPTGMFEEKNSGTNLPAEINLYAEKGSQYDFLFVAKGGGSANKSFLFQETKSLLNEKSLTQFIKEKIKMLGTSACPPYHLALVIGGTSAEMNLKTVKLASCKFYDQLPTKPTDESLAFRDLEWEEKIHEIAIATGIGAQFGGKYYTHDVRVIRLPRHAASCPVGLGVSCSADRNILGKITEEGIFLEELEKNPGQYLPLAKKECSTPVAINLNAPMKEILKQLHGLPIKTRLSLTGSLIVARDTAHARIQQMLDRGEPMPEYFKKYPVYYAGPAKTPEGMASGSFGPTTASRMDPYVGPFMAKGGSLIMLAKGNRAPSVREACKEFGGFYLGSIGGPAAILAKENILSVELLDFEELGMEAVRKIDVKDFPAFIVCDDLGNDFYENIKPE